MTDNMILIGIIDRFEGGFAVIEVTGEPELRNVPKKLLPRGAKEGDHLQLELEDGQVIRVQIDPEATEEARKRIQEKLDRLRRGDHLRND